MAQSYYIPLVASPQIDGGSGGGGDNGFFDISIDQDAETIDKTFAEIDTAIEAGKTIRIVTDGAASSTAIPVKVSDTQIFIYPIWYEFNDFAIAETPVMTISTQEIEVIDDGQVSFGKYAEFTISGTF